VKILLNGWSPPSPVTGKVGAALGPYLEQIGHTLVATEAEAEAMVDFTAPDVVVPNIRRAVAAGVPCVVGTTGWDTAEVDAEAREAGVAVFFAPNFAIGAVLMMRFAAEASAYMDAAEVIELHHATKVDAPSGTAKATAAAMRGDVPIHSVRLPGLVAHQEVIFGGEGQLLTIRHDTTGRESFADGVLLALEKLPELPPGLTIGLESLIS
jgi:4-hydroxy-tetrahydrodipicolinate reductase